MKTLVSDYKASDGKDYFNVALNIATGQAIMIKNASCTAEAVEIANNYFSCNNHLYSLQNIKVFFMVTSRN